MSIRNKGAAALLALLLSIAFFVSAEARDIDVRVVLGDGPRHVYSEHGVPNGMPCDWYAYATSVGLSYCAHPGVDLAVYYEPIYAATDGIVEFAGSDGYYAPLHVNVRSTSRRFDKELHIYGHLSEIVAVQGQHVKRGDLLGITGEAGNAPHLHFERRTAPKDGYAGGIAIDPEPVLEWDGTYP